MRRDELTQPVDRQPPDIAIVHLKGIIPAVLPEPQLDVVTAQFLGELSCLIKQLQRLGPSGGIRVGDRALHVVPVVDLRRNGDGSKLVALEGRLDVIQAAVKTGEGPIQVDD
jgi:hypothetical protein